jgi:hypothetical protein
MLCKIWVEKSYFIRELIWLLCDYLAFSTACILFRVRALGMTTNNLSAFLAEQMIFFVFVSLIKKTINGECVSNFPSVWHATKITVKSVADTKILEMCVFCLAPYFNNCSYTCSYTSIKIIVL